jgi:hypothetical protein
VAAGLGLIVLVVDLVYALSTFRQLSRSPDDDNSGPLGAILVLWLLLAIAFAAFGTYGAARGRVPWVWFAGACEFLQLLILLSFGGAFWAMYLGAGLGVLAAVIGGDRRVAPRASRQRPDC